MRFILFLCSRLVSVLQSGFSSFIIANYHVGDVLASFIVFIFSSIIRFTPHFLLNTNLSLTSYFQRAQYPDISLQDLTRRPACVPL